MKVKECIFPKESMIAHEVVSSNFHDSYKISSIENNISPLEIYLAMVNNTPIWINLLLSLRNIMVQPFGLKDVGNLGGISFLDNVKTEHLVGTKLDIFIIESFNKNEMILQQKDKHLDIKLSILIHEDTDIIVSTIVNFNNLLGKIYMFIIAPLHKIIVKRLMKNIIFNKTNNKGI